MRAVSVEGMEAKLSEAIAPDADGPANRWLTDTAT